MNLSRLRFLVVMLPIILFVLSFTHTVLYADDIILTGDQQMVIENTAYTQTGNIYVRDNAKLTIKKATLIMNIRYHEEFVVEVSGSGKLEIADSIIDISIPGECVIID